MMYDRPCRTIVFDEIEISSNFKNAKLSKTLLTFFLLQTDPALLRRFSKFSCHDLSGKKIRHQHSCSQTPSSNDLPHVYDCDVISQEQLQDQFSTFFLEYKRKCCILRHSVTRKLCSILIYKKFRISVSICSINCT